MYSPSGHYACKAVNEQFRVRFRFPLLRKKPELILFRLICYFSNQAWLNFCCEAKYEKYKIGKINGATLQKSK